MIDLFTEIISGWKNYVFPNKEVEKIAVQRILTCIECPKFTSKKTCGICKCYMPAKTRSINATCPLKKW